MNRREFVNDTVWMGAVALVVGCQLNRRGNWKNVKPWGIVNVDLKKMGLDKVRKDDAALNV